MNEARHFEEEWLLSFEWKICTHPKLLIFKLFFVKHWTHKNIPSECRTHKFSRVRRIHIRSKFTKRKIFLGKNTNKIVCYRNDNNNHIGNNDNKIEIRLQNYQINFLLIVFGKKLDTWKRKRKGRSYLYLWYSAVVGEQKVLTFNIPFAVYSVLSNSIRYLIMNFGSLCKEKYMAM